MKLTMQVLGQWISTLPGTLKSIDYKTILSKYSFSMNTGPVKILNDCNAQK